MEPVIRGALIYLLLLVIFSMAGKRSLSEMDTFDLILLLIISEACQHALVGENYSFTYGLLVIITLVSCEVLMVFLKSRFPGFDKATQGGPLIIVDNGKLLKDRMKKAMVDEEDILSSARESQALKRLDEIKYAILETSGQISIIPKEREAH
jgi:uncharacterized membrane protein YcaP (DUF421 family)